MSVIMENQTVRTNLRSRAEGMSLGDVVSVSGTAVKHRTTAIITLDKGNP